MHPVTKVTKVTEVVIVGGGFAGLNAAKVLGRSSRVSVTLVDKQNHHLFQPLLYQVAMAGLSPADIAAPIRSMLSRFPNTKVLLGEVRSLDLAHRTVWADIGPLPFDYLVLCAGAATSYFGHDEWEHHAPGLKTLDDATEIRRRVLTAFEQAERITDPDEQRQFLTFVIVGGGPTGVELAGAIGEMSRHTLAKDFRSINAKATRVILLEAGPRILPMFSAAHAARAVPDLEALGVEVRTASAVTAIDPQGVQMGPMRLEAKTVLWAAGMTASPLGRAAALEVDPQGRVHVEPDLSVKGYANVFVAGDLARFTHQTGAPLPGTAPVAMQQGRYVARTILGDLEGRTRQPFRFVDKGQMATIGRSKAIVELGPAADRRISRVADMARRSHLLSDRLQEPTPRRAAVGLVMYVTFGRGARLIVGRKWRGPDAPD